MRKMILWIMRCVPIVVVFANGALASTYQVMTVEPSVLNVQVPHLPDISSYTPEEVQKKIDSARRGKPGTVTKRLVRGLAEMRVLYSGNGILEMGVMQGDLPSVLVVENGQMTLQEVSQAYPEQLVQVAEDEYVARLPLVVGIHATLIIEDTVLKLSEERGAFLVNGGQFFLQGGALLGWRESTNTPAYFTGDKHRFRPFYISWGGSYTYFSETTSASLGYLNTKAYGITLSSYSVKTSEKVFQQKEFDFFQPPRGWFINSTFTDMFYGFYSHEAEDIAIINNIYADNVIYGIDPHDRSKGLIIAKNQVYGTKVKHGIIISREVNESFIFGNESYDNTLSGIMLDRMSFRNQVVNNTIYRNGSDGITLYESGDNLISANIIYGNQDHGIHLRNSADVTMSNNLILNNGAFGVCLHTRDLVDHEYRDVEKDPYEQVVSGTLLGGTLLGNRSGSVFVKNSRLFNLYNVAIENERTGRIDFGGDLEQYQNDIIRSLWRDKGVASLRQREGL